MTSRMPGISVVIPTHNRSNSLHRLLDALCVQTYPLDAIEAVIVADDCSDGTMEMLRGYEAPFSIRVFEQPDRSAAVARNRGASHAEGRLLVFVDDDMEPAPDFIRAHVDAHRAPGAVAMGYSIPLVDGRNDFFSIALRGWWEAMYEVMREPGHRFTYRNLISNNFSLEAAVFKHVGGFDTTFPGACYEDYELGARLIQAGASLTFAGEAIT